MRTDLTLNSPASLRISGVRFFAPLAIVAASLCGAPMLCAQTAATAVPFKPSHSVHRPVHPRKRPAATPAQSPAPQAALPATPPVPETPA